MRYPFLGDDGRSSLFGPPIEDPFPHFAYEGVHLTYYHSLEPSSYLTTMGKRVEARGTTIVAYSIVTEPGSYTHVGLLFASKLIHQARHFFDYQSSSRPDINPLTLKRIDRDNYRTAYYYFRLVIDFHRSRGSPVTNIDDSFFLNKEIVINCPTPRPYLRGHHHSKRPPRYLPLDRRSYNRRGLRSLSPLPVIPGTDAPSSSPLHSFLRTIIRGSEGLILWIVNAPLITPLLETIATDDPSLRMISPSLLRDRSSISDRFIVVSSDPPSRSELTPVMMVLIPGMLPDTFDYLFTNHRGRTLATIAAGLPRTRKIIRMIRPLSDYPRDETILTPSSRARYWNDNQWPSFTGATIQSLPLSSFDREQYHYHQITIQSSEGMISSRIFSPILPR